MKIKTIQSGFLLFLAFLYLAISGCASNPDAPIDIKNVSANKSVITTQSLGDLPVPISNNAVASAEVNGETRLYSFLGLESGKEWSDVSKKAFKYSNSTWTQMQDVPVPEGRLASVAVTVKNQIYLFGGYSVAEDHSEISTPEVLRFDPVNETYTRIADIPVPSDDAVALVYEERYIYLISGWHDKGNINLVQVYDIESDSWKQATQFPGSPVFGHAGGIVENHMLICDGVKISYPKLSEGELAKREFVMSDECYIGKIDNNDPYRIHWSVVPSHPGAARYRVAASGNKKSKRILFVGGSDNPYNFNVIGYNGEPSNPESAVFAFDLDSNNWMQLGFVNTPTMDHRSLLQFDDGLVVIGGMGKEQTVLGKTYKLTIN